jgi:mRNA interferase MazF
MANFKAGDIVKVPFPYTDRATRQRRPALVVSATGLEEAHGLLWVAMITSAENRAWPSDVAIDDLAETGLPVRSLIRTAKIATIEARDAEPLGQIDATLKGQVHRQIAMQLGL